MNEDTNTVAAASEKGIKPAIWFLGWEATDRFIEWPTDSHAASSLHLAFLTKGTGVTEPQPSRGLSGDSDMEPRA